MNNKGYTLLFAILISSIVLTIGVSILNIARKELLLSSGAKESEIAIFEADNGFECAMYWNAQNTFSTTTGNFSDFTSAIKCDGYDITVATDWQTGVSEFKLIQSSDEPGSLKRCAKVTVTKEYVSVPGISRRIIQTTINSRGYNVGDTSCEGVNPKRVERALEYVYQ